MKKFPIGTRVKKTMGIRMSGTIVKPFYWKQSTDGTYKAPDKREQAVEWDNGTKGYSFIDHIEELKKNPATETRELALYIENNGDLYRRQTLSIIKNLQRKIAKGTYDPAKALILWKHLADSGAQLYVKEFGGPGDNWHQMFSVADRKAAAAELADRYEEHVREKPMTAKRAKRQSTRVTKFLSNPPFGKRKRVGMKHRDQKRIPMAIEVNTMASSLGLRSKSLDELIAMYNKHRKMRGSFIAKVIAEAAKQVAITKGAKIVRK
jgi:hypothetical protein